MSGLCHEMSKPMVSRLSSTSLPYLFDRKQELENWVQWGIVQSLYARGKVYI